MAKLDAHERLVTHHSITIDTQFRTQIDEKTKQQCICPVPEMTQLAPLIIETIGLHHRYERGDVILTLQDARLYSSREDSVPTHIALMVNAVDKNGSATVLKNTETKSRMEFSPKYDEGEGYEVSAHIAICLSGEKRTYDMAYTPIPGISTGRMNSFLDRVLFKISKDHERDFTYSSPTYLVDPQNNKKIKILYKAVFDLKGKLDEELFTKLSSNGLSDVLLIKDEFSTINAPDVNSAYIPKQTTLRLHPNHGKDVIGWLKNLGSHFKKDTNGGYDKIKIKFTEPDTNSPRQVEFSTNNIKLDALEKTFVKKNIISGFSSRLKDSYDTINDEFIKKIVDLM